jgi:hypothetical protein
MKYVLRIVDTITVRSLETTQHYIATHLFLKFRSDFY